MVTVSDHFGTFLMITDDNTVLIFLVWESHGAIAGYWGACIELKILAFDFSYHPHGIQSVANAPPNPQNVGAE